MYDLRSTFDCKTFVQIQIRQFKKILHVLPLWAINELFEAFLELYEENIWNNASLKISMARIETKDLKLSKNQQRNFNETFMKIEEVTSALISVGLVKIFFKLSVYKFPSTWFHEPTSSLTMQCNKNLCMIIKSLFHLKTSTATPASFQTQTEAKGRKRQLVVESRKEAFKSSTEAPQFRDVNISHQSPSLI